MLQWYLVLMALLGEGALALLLILPLPQGIRKVILKLMSDSWKNKNVRTLLITWFCVVVFLSTDAYRSMNYHKEQIRLEHMTVGGSTAHEDQHRIQLYRAERNLSYCVFSLFLGLLLWRFTTMITAMLSIQAKAEALAKQATNNSGGYTDALKENGDLKKKIKDMEKSLKELQMIKKQAENTEKAYMELLDEKSDTTVKKPSEKKND